MRMLLFDFVVPALPGTDKGYGGTPSYAMSVSLSKRRVIDPLQEVRCKSLGSLSERLVIGSLQELAARVLRFSGSISEAPGSSSIRFNRHRSLYLRGVSSPLRKTFCSSTPEVHHLRVSSVVAAAASAVRRSQAAYEAEVLL
eukprot:83546-Rhodomonas_salina.4